MELDRRKFVQLLSATVAASSSSTCDATESATMLKAGFTLKSKRPRNVVLIVCDDLGYGDLGCFGSKIKTPNLDRMASDGLLCTHFNAAHPICSASRAALLTGRYAQRSHTATVYFPVDKTGMSLEETTLANLFQDSGYRTRAIGKWHLGHAPEYLPTQRGFDSFLGVPYSVDMKPLPLLKNAQVLEADTDRDMLTRRYTENAITFLDEEDTTPFFLYMAYSYPHDPARASPPFRGISGFGDHGDSVQEIDWSVGKITEALERKGLLSDTLMLFTSDHGPWYQGSPGTLRGRKSSTFEGGFRVPLIVRWPNAIRPNSVSDRWASNLDIVPTLAALCGLKASPKLLDGIDITNILVGQPDVVDRQAVLYFSPGAGGNNIHCARKGQWKLRVAQHDGEIYINDYTDGKVHYWLPRPELYNLLNDPTESYDVAKVYPNLVQEILQDLKAQVPSFPDEVGKAFTSLRQNIARVTTPPGGAPRPNTSNPVPGWMWEPEDRR